MNWFKILNKKDKPAKVVKNLVEQIDYEKIRKITREEIKREQENGWKVEIDCEKLAEAIVRANRLSKDTEAAAAKKAHEDMIKERMESLGERDFSHIKNWLWRSVRTIFNKGFVFLRLLFVPREIAKNISAVDSLFKMITALFFGFARLILYIAVGYLLVQTFLLCNLLLLPYAFVTFVFAQIIRIAQIEVEHMEDRGYLMAISGSILAIASLVVAILAEFDVI